MEKVLKDGGETPGPEFHISKGLNSNLDGKKFEELDSREVKCCLQAGDKVKKRVRPTADRGKKQRSNGKKMTSGEIRI